MSRRLALLDTVFHVSVVVVFASGSIVEADRLAVPRVLDPSSRTAVRVGRIKVDRTRGEFFVRGEVLRHEPPLEYLAGTRDGEKGYETFLELAASAENFNVACILVGLDAANARRPEQHFDPRPVLGDPVGLELTWRRDGALQRRSPGDLVRMADASLDPGGWRYTGSGFLPDGSYMAARDGTLIGFVHDPAPIIEHSTGFLDGFEAVAIDPALAPPVGTAVTLRVWRDAARKPATVSDVP